MNSENSKTSDLCRLSLNLMDKIDLREKNKYIALSNLNIYYKWKIMKKPYKNNKFKVSSASAWNEEFELLDGPYSISVVKIISNIKININKIKNRITLIIKTRYYLELLTPETMNLLGSTKIKIIKNENGENVPRLEITEVILIHCNVVNNSY